MRNGIVIKTGLVYGTTDYVDTTGTNGQWYFYQVAYVNECSKTANTIGGSVTDGIDVSCAEVGNTLKINKSGTDAVISWDAVTCDNFASYRVFGSPVYNALFPFYWTVLGNPASANFSDPLSSNNVAYKIMVLAFCD